MKKALVLLGVVVLVIIAHACKKEKPTPPSNPGPEDTTYKPTPYQLQIPAYVIQHLGEMPNPSDNPLTVEGVALGRKLFYEKMLSNTATISCASCHQQQHAFDDPRRFSEGTDGSLGTRNAMTIVNMGWGNSFFWDGRKNTLEEQAHDPVTNPVEMANTWPEVVSRLQGSTVYPDLFYKAFGTRAIDSNLVVKAIAQFERTLISFNSRFDKYYYGGDSSALNAQEQRGLNLFMNEGMCATCHSMNMLLTDRLFRSNGANANPNDRGRMDITGNPYDRGLFKVPTLRNVALTAPYMHDGDMANLQDVVGFYGMHLVSGNEIIGGPGAPPPPVKTLTEEQQADLVAFLKSLTDEEFITNPAFSDPNL